MFARTTSYCQPQSSIPFNPSSSPFLLVSSNLSGFLETVRPQSIDPCLEPSLLRPPPHHPNFQRSSPKAIIFANVRKAYCYGRITITVTPQNPSSNKYYAALESLSATASLYVVHRSDTCDTVLMSTPTNPSGLGKSTYLRFAVLSKYRASG